VSKLLTTLQAAEILGVSDARVRQLVLDGRLPAQKFGRDLAIQEKDLKLVQDRKPGRPRKLGDSENKGKKQERKKQSS
jgi:excisionase family DNA binding protein